MHNLQNNLKILSHTKTVDKSSKELIRRERRDNRWLNDKKWNNMTCREITNFYTWCPAVPATVSPFFVGRLCPATPGSRRCDIHTLIRLQLRLQNCHREHYNARRTGDLLVTVSSSKHSPRVFHTALSRHQTISSSTSLVVPPSPLSTNLWRKTDIHNMAPKFTVADAPSPATRHTCSKQPAPRQPAVAPILFYGCSDPLGTASRRCPAPK